MIRYPFITTSITLFWGVLAVCLVGCHTIAPLPREKNVDALQTPRYQPDTTVLPTFPAKVLYLFGMEWEALNDTTSAKYHTPRAEQTRQASMTMADYIDERLIEWFPDRAYAGYAAKIERLAENLILANNEQRAVKNRIWNELPTPQRLRATRHHPRPMDRDLNGHDEVPDSLLLAQERDILQLTAAERKGLHVIHHLAYDTLWATPSDWDSLIACFVDRTDVHIETMADTAGRNGWDRTDSTDIYRPSLDTLNTSFWEEENLALSLLLWQGPRMFYRVIQSKQRATHLAEFYYPGATNGGQKGDAFRHTYVNALLRTYVGLPLTYLIMDIFWEVAKPNAPCDRYMDLHNNVVGRRTHYSDFVYSTPQDTLPDWQQWAEHIHLYIETPSNAAYKDWNRQTPSFIVIPQAEAVDQQSYIYWR